MDRLKVGMRVRIRDYQEILAARPTNYIAPNGSVHLTDDDGFKVNSFPKVMQYLSGKTATISSIKKVSICHSVYLITLKDVEGDHNASRWSFYDDMVEPCFDNTDMEWV